MENMRVSEKNECDVELHSSASINKRNSARERGQNYFSRKYDL
jgi:hypothetical protein